MSNRFKDFDAFRKEPEPIGFRFAGSDYKVRGSIPMIVVLDAQRLQGRVKEAEAKVKAGEVEDISEVLSEEELGSLASSFERVFGKENWRRMLEAGIDDATAQDILQWVMQTASGAGDEAEGEEAGPKPSGGAKGTESASPTTTSSSTGAPSSPISPASGLIPPTT